MIKEKDFRVWDIQNRKMFFPKVEEIGKYIVDKTNYIVMEYTMVDDVNGKKIFEYDIVRPVNFKDIGNVVRFVSGAFYRLKVLNGKKYWNTLGNCKIKLVGNILENKEELLK